MGRGLYDYAKMTPTAAEVPQAISREPDAIDKYREQQAAIEKTKYLMESIEAQLQQGAPPQNVLYTALRCIALLTGANDWEQRQREALDAIYKDLAQESLFTDNAVIAAARLEDQKAQYIEKTRRRLKRIESETSTVYGLVQAVYGHLAALEDDVEAVESPGQVIYHGDGAARLHLRYCDQQARERKE